MKFIRFIILGLWTTFSVFSYTDLSPEMQNQPTYEEYKFEPDPGNPGVEVAPLDVNAQDEDIPFPNTFNQNNTNNLEVIKNNKTIEQPQLEE